jgi:hypothetical protein
LQIIKIARGKYQVANLDTGKIHAHSTSLKKAKRQVHLINSLEGDGIFDVARSKLKEIRNESPNALNKIN